MDLTRTGSTERSGYALLKNWLGFVSSRLEVFLPLMIFGVGLGCWEWGARSGRIAMLYFPAPSIIATTLAKLTRDGTLMESIAATLSRVFSGVLLGGAPGLALGITMGWSRRVRSALDPFIAAAHPVPKVAVLPIILIIFGMGELSKAVVVSVSAFFPILINSIWAVQQISPIHFEVAQNYGAGRMKVLTRVILPGSLPLILAGVRLALNAAFLTTIVVELLIARTGLGAMLWMARETLRTEELYAGLFVIAILGMSFNFILQRLALRLVPWQPKIARDV